MPHLSLCQIPFERLAGEAVVVDITAKSKTDPDAKLEPSDLEAWEEEHGRIPDGAVVVMYSGWGERFSKNYTEYFGMSREEAAAGGAEAFSRMHYPGFTKEAAEWLVNNRYTSRKLSFFRTERYFTLFPLPLSNAFKLTGRSDHFLLPPQKHRRNGCRYSFHG